MPAPDSAAEQGCELLRSPAHDWAGLHVVPWAALGAAAANPAPAQPAPRAAAAALRANPTATNLPTAPRNAPTRRPPSLIAARRSRATPATPNPDPTADEDLLYDPNS